MKEKSLRLFYALWPDEEVRKSLKHLQRLTRGRLTRPENLHITLAFLGQQSADTLPQLKSILADLPRCDIALSINRLGYFKKNRIAWAGMGEAPDALLGLHKTLVHQLEQQGIEFDKPGKFTPHITLAREADPTIDSSFEPIAWNASQVALVQSTQVEGVLTYRVLASRLLNDFG